MLQLRKSANDNAGVGTDCRICHDRTSLTCHIFMLDPSWSRIGLMHEEHFG